MMSLADMRDRIREVVDKHMTDGISVIMQDIIWNQIDQIGVGSEDMEAAMNKIVLVFKLLIDQEIADSISGEFEKILKFPDASPVPWGEGAL